MDIIDKLLGLQKQATTERTHFYVAACITEAIQEIMSLRKLTQQECKTEMIIEPNKLKCSECGWRGEIKEVLVADNPFSAFGSIYGCPHCRDIDRLEAVCDEPECWFVAYYGTQTRDGYRNTCGYHKPKKE